MSEVLASKMIERGGEVGLMWGLGYGDVSDNLGEKIYLCKIRDTYLQGIESKQSLDSQG